MDKLLSKYPLDLNQLTKGQLIDIPTLEAITSHRHGTTAFQFAVLALMDRINHRTTMTAKTTPEGLRILTDSEASEYNNRRFGINMGAMIRRHGKSLQVDACVLSSDEQRQHERRVLGQSRYVSAIASASKTLKLPGRSKRAEQRQVEPTHEQS